MNTDKINFVNDIKSFMASHSASALKRKVEANSGKLSFRLNDQDVELTLRKEFFYSAKDQVAADEKKNN